MAEAEMTTYLTPDFQRSLRRYVLGDLQEPARSELEDLLITDPDMFEALAVVEDELIEEYLDGAAAEADRRDFERHFLTSPPRLARLRFTRALRNRAAVEMPAESPPSRRPVLRSPRWQPAWLAAAAALAVSLSANLWLTLGREAQTVEVSQPFAYPLNEARVPIGEDEALVQELQNKLEREQSERSKAEARVTSLEAILRSRAKAPTFALAAGLLRAGGAMPRVTLATGTIIVRLRLELAGDDYPSYRAVLLDAEGDEVWTASKLKTETESNSAAVVLVLPTGLLPRGDYQVKLSGVAEQGQAEAIATYAFSVTEVGHEPRK